MRILSAILLTPTYYLIKVIKERHEELFRHEVFPREAWLEHIRNGRVLLDGTAVSHPDHEMAKGQKLEVCQIAIAATSSSFLSLASVGMVFRWRLFVLPLCNLNSCFSFLVYRLYGWLHHCCARWLR